MSESEWHQWYLCGQFREALNVLFGQREGSELEVDISAVTSACKAVIGPLRESRRKILKEEMYQRGIGNVRRENIIEALRKEVEEELGAWLVKIIGFARGRTGEDKIFRIKILKLEADHLRYMSEISIDGVELRRVDDLYSEALSIAETMISEPGDIAATIAYSGIALCYSVFCFEILRQPERAIGIAREGFTKCNRSLGKNDEILLKNIQRFRDNIALWISIDDMFLA
jgi:hypothetical protein